MEILRAIDYVEVTDVANAVEGSFTTGDEDDEVSSRAENEVRWSKVSEDYSTYTVYKSTNDNHKRSVNKVENA